MSFESKLLSKLALGLLVGAAFATTSFETLAQDAGAPVGPIEITMPSSAGSTPDVLMRPMGQIMNEKGS